MIVPTSQMAHRWKVNVARIPHTIAPALANRARAPCTVALCDAVILLASFPPTAQGWHKAIVQLHDHSPCCHQCLSSAALDPMYQDTENTHTQCTWVLSIPQIADPPTCKKSAKPRLVLHFSERTPLNMTRVTPGRPPRIGQWAQMSCPETQILTG